MIHAENRKTRAGRLAPLIIPAAITVVGAGLRLYALGARSLWVDEALRYTLATISWPRFFFVLWSFEPWMPFYHILLRLWVHVGDSELLLRLPSAVFGIATIPVLYALGKQLFDRKIGEIAAILIALHTIHIDYSQQAVAYSMMILFCALSSLFFLQAMAKDRTRDWLAYTVITVLATYVHFFAILLVPAHCASLPFFGRKRAAKRFLIAAVLIGIAFIPLMCAARVASAPAQYGWRPGVTPSALLRIFCAFAGALHTAAGALIAGLYAIALRSAVGAFNRARAECRRDRASWGFLFMTAFVPLGLLVLASFFRPLLVPRYILVGLPTFVVLVAAGIARLPQKSALVVMSSLLSLAVWQNYQYYTEFGREDWRQTVRYVLAAARPDDAIIVFPADARMAYEYCVTHGNAGVARPEIAFPRWDEFFRLNGTFVFDLTATPMDEGTLRAVRAVHPRLWIIGNMTDPDPAFPLAFRALVDSAHRAYPHGSRVPAV